MNSDRNNDVLMMEFFEALNSENSDSMRQLLQSILNVTMKLEREQALGAKPSRKRNPSVKLAKKIEEITEGKVSKEEVLFPEDFQQEEN